MTGTEHGCGEEPTKETTAKELENTEPKFPIGKLVITPNALESIEPFEVTAALARHAAGDWGECGREDWRENELSLKEGFRLLSVYHSEKGGKFWVITEADRSATTVLMPEDY